MGVECRWVCAERQVQIGSLNYDTVLHSNSMAVWSVIPYVWAVVAVYYALSV